MLVATNFLSKTILSQAIAAGKILDGVKLLLFKAPHSLSKTTALADLTEADFVGYARSSAVVWTGPFTGSDGIPVVVGDTKVFTAGADPINAQTIYGYGVVDAAGTHLLWAENFTDPANMVNSGDTLIVVPQLGDTSQASIG